MSNASPESQPIPLDPSALVKYTESVETKQENEDEVFQQINEAMHMIGETMLDRFRHGIRSVHAKSHGLLKAELKVYGDLPEYLQQGLFAHAGTYPVIMRFSTNPGDILPDTISTPRGLAWKVLNVPGEMLPENEGNTTQDFVFVNGKAFPAKDAQSFLDSQKPIVANLNDDPLTKDIVSNVARGANAVLTAVGLEQPQLEALGYPKTQILAETFGSLVPLRYGDYFGKIVLAPKSENLKALAEQRFHTHRHYSALKENIQEFFKTETAVWEVQVQLCADLEKMPVEDASVEWPESLSPYVAVADLTALPQESYSPARRVYADDHLQFNPWHSLAAHQPLGQIMRARKVAYAAAKQQRSHNNAVEIAEPKSIDELPD